MMIMGWVFDKRFVDYQLQQEYLMIGLKHSFFVILFLTYFNPSNNVVIVHPVLRIHYCLQILLQSS